MTSFAKWSSLVAIAAAGMLAVGCGEVHAKPDGGGGGDDGGGDDGGSGSCVASTKLRCDGTKLVSCNAAGTGEEQTQCGLRCDATALACEDKVKPSNGYAAQLDAATGEPAVSITAATNVDIKNDYNDTNKQLKIGNQQVKATLVAGTNGAPDIVVASVGSLSVATGVTLTLGAQPGDPGIAIMSAGDVSILGTLKVINGGSMPASAPCTGVSTTAVGTNNDNPGGGGGGFAQVGGAGGAVLVVGNGGAGGQSAGDPTLVPLRGGCSGGKNPFGALGIGGGALQITSATKIIVGGIVAANGLGGVASTGGGSGGGILLEAPSVAVSGGLFANGGGGGCGSFTSSGSDGNMSTAPAFGDICPNNVHGGNGGAGTTAPTAGDSVSNTANQDYAGGGGGGVGRIRINSVDMTVLFTGMQSPAASLGLIAGR